VWGMPLDIACFLRDIASFDTWANVANVSLSEEHAGHGARIGRDRLLAGR
jgi:hypothetical protein